MPDENLELDGAEVVLLIQALDALIPFTDESRYLASKVERHTWAQHNILRGKLKESIHMSFYSRADTWLESELQAERIALTDKLHSRLAELLREPGATRRTVREGFVSTIQELRETRQSKPRPLS
jgi:hypothetical protein